MHWYFVSVYDTSRFFDSRQVSNIKFDSYDSYDGDKKLIIDQDDEYLLPERVLSYSRSLFSSINTYIIRHLPLSTGSSSSSTVVVFVITQNSIKKTKNGFGDDDDDDNDNNGKQIQETISLLLLLLVVVVYSTQQNQLEPSDPIRR